MSMVRPIRCGSAAPAIAVSHAVFASPGARQRADNEYQVQRYRNAVRRMGPAPAPPIASK